MLGCKHGVRSMLKLPKDWDKSIINISSILGIVGSQTSFSYSGSKGAVRLLTKSVAIHLAQRQTGIRCNSVHVGRPLCSETWNDVEPRFLFSFPSFCLILTFHSLIFSAPQILFRSPATLNRK